MSGAAPQPAHLVHGMGTGLTAPAWPAIVTEEAAAVLAHYPAAGRLVALHWHSPRPFSAATLLETGEGEFLLKRHHKSLRTRAALGEEHAFMAHLRPRLCARRLSVPVVVAAGDGASAVGRGEWRYELHRSAPGRDLYRDRQSWTSFLTHGHAREAGTALAHMHLTARSYSGVPREAHALIASFTILPSDDPLAAAAAYVMARPALAAFLADMPWQAELASLFAALGSGLSDRLAGQPPLWTHNDWHPSNLLWSPEGTVSAIFDFGLATRTCAVHDLATAIERTAIPWLYLRDGSLAEPADAGAAVALLAGYRTVLPLSGADIATIIRLLPLVHVEFALSEIDYFAGILNDRDQATVAWQDYLVDHARWFLSSAGQAFLRQVEEEASV